MTRKKNMINITRATDAGNFFFAKSECYSEKQSFPGSCSEILVIVVYKYNWKNFGDFFTLFGISHEYYLETLADPATASSLEISTRTSSRANRFR